MARTLLLYGESSLYKSSNLGEIADYIYATRDKQTHLISADSSWAPMGDQIRRGVIIPWNLKACTVPLPALQKACRGYWPKSLDPATGIMDERYGMEMTDWAQVGCLLIEGLYMIAELLKDDLLTKNRATGEPLTAVFTEDGENFASTSRGTYKFVQEQTHIYVKNASGLPCDWVIFTGHEGKGKDVTGRMTMGPAILGQALTDKVAGWFESVLHHESYSYTDASSGTGTRRDGVRAYFERHPDPDISNIFWPAKIGVEPRVKAQVLKRWQHGYVPLLLDSEGNYVESVATLLGEIEAAEKGQTDQS